MQDKNPLPVGGDSGRAGAGREPSPREAPGLDGAHRGTLSYARDRLEALFEASAAGIVALDPEGRVEIWNASAERVYGWRADEVIGKPFPALTERELAEAMAGNARGERVDGIVVTHQRKDGSPIELIVSRAPVRDDSGRIVGAMGVFADFTEQRRLQAQVASTQRIESIGRLAAGIAHDFNNVLAVVVGLGALLLDRLDGQDRDDVAVLLSAAERGRTLTHQLLAFARGPSGRGCSLVLDERVSELDKMLRRLLGEDVELVTLLHEGTWPVHADPAHVDQLLLNLVVNARDAMPAGGRLTVRTENRGAGLAPEGARSVDHVALIVEDQGAGMDEATRLRVFEPFFTTKGATGGTGLGLATCFGILKEWGGWMDVASAPGVGSTFTMCFPRASHSEPELRSAPARMPSRGSETVLIADDDDAVRSMMARILRSHGYAVIEAPNGEAALRAVSEHQGPIDLLVTDVVMPLMDGVTLASHLALARGTKVLFVSGYPGHNSTIERTRSPYLAKPFLPSELMRAVRQALDAPK